MANIVKSQLSEAERQMIRTESKSASKHYVTAFIREHIPPRHKFRHGGDHTSTNWREKALKEVTDKIETLVQASDPNEPVKELKNRVMQLATTNFDPNVCGDRREFETFVLQGAVQSVAMLPCLEPRVPEVLQPSHRRGRHRG